MLFRNLSPKIWIAYLITPLQDLSVKKSSNLILSFDEIFIYAYCSSNYRSLFLLRCLFLAFCGVLIAYHNLLQ